MTRDMWHMVGGEHSLKISGPKLLRFGIDSVLKILNERMTQLMNKSISDEGVCRTAPATPGLLIRQHVLDELNTIKSGHTKVKHIVHSDLKNPQKYVTCSKFSNKQKNLAV